MRSKNELKHIADLLTWWPGETTLEKVTYLLESQQRMVHELDYGQRAKYREEMENAYKKAYQDTLDNRYVLKTDLGKMSIAEIAQMLGYTEE